MNKIIRVTLPAMLLILAMALGAWTTPNVAQSGTTATPKPAGQTASPQASPKASQQAQATPKAGQSGAAQFGAQEQQEQAGEKSVRIPTSINPVVLLLNVDLSGKSSASSSKNKMINSSALTLSGSLGKAQGVQERIQAISAFQFDMNSFSTTSLSDMDKEFIQDSLTSNSLELLSMQYSLPLVKDSEVRSLIQMMIYMHAKDQQTLLQIAGKAGVDASSVDFANASVFPETPDYDLGMRTENLTTKYLDHIVEPSRGSSYDDVVLHVLDSEHTSDVQSELVAERVVQDSALKAFAKHSADVTELHLALLDMVSSRVSVHLDEVNQPDFSAGYMSPAEITVSGQSSQGQSGANQSGTNQPGSSQSGTATPSGSK